MSRATNFGYARSEFLRSVASSGRGLQITTSGVSMLPTIAPGSPVRVCSSTSRDITPGDVVLIMTQHSLVLHRYVAPHRCGLVTLGDNLELCDPIVRRWQLIGSVHELSDEKWAEIHNARGAKILERWEERNRSEPSRLKVAVSPFGAIALSDLASALRSMSGRGVEVRISLGYYYGRRPDSISSRVRDGKCADLHVRIGDPGQEFGRSKLRRKVSGLVPAAVIEEWPGWSRRGGLSASMESTA